MNTNIEKCFTLFRNRMQGFESKKILLMLSGGVDSMVLAFFLLKVKEEMNLDLACFHLNHMYRGKEADGDADFARDFCKKHGLKHYVESRDVPKIAEESKLGFEHCARNVRLFLAEDIRDKDAYDYVATAHHLDDSVETVVHNFIRGASIQGLRGMDFLNGHFIRPLIDIKKEEIRDIAEFYGIEYREDSSNEDTDFTRNLIRHSLIPEMLKINPNFKNTLKNASQTLREDGDYLHSQARKNLERLCSSVSSVSNSSTLDWEDVIKLDLLGFRELDIAIQKRILRLVIEKFKGNLVDVYSSIIEEIINLSKSESSGKQVAFKGIIFEISRDKMVIALEKRQEKEGLDLVLGESFFSGWEIKARKVDYLEALSLYSEKDMTSILLPLQVFQQGLVLRRWISGDYIRAARLKGSQKSLKKLFVDLKLSRIEKDRQVILSGKDRSNAEEVFWVPGLEKISTAKALEKNRTGTIVYIKMTRK